MKNKCLRSLILLLLAVLTAFAVGAARAQIAALMQRFCGMITE